jgi:hypothetical protein
MFSLKEKSTGKDFILENKRRVREYQRSRSPELHKEYQPSDHLDVPRPSSLVQHTSSAVRSVSQPKRRSSISRNSQQRKFSDDLWSDSRVESEPSPTPPKDELQSSKRSLSASRPTKSVQKAHHPRAWGSGDGLRTVEKIKEPVFNSVDQIEPRVVKVTSTPRIRKRDEVFKGKYKARDEIHILSNRISVRQPSFLLF